VEAEQSETRCAGFVSSRQQEFGIWFLPSEAKGPGKVCERVKEAGLENDWMSFEFAPG